jgi:hypothetical protein
MNCSRYKITHKHKPSGICLIINTIYKRGKLTDKNKYFLRFYLIDGSSFHISYWIDENVMTPGGFGSDLIKEIVLSQLNE